MVITERYGGDGVSSTAGVLTPIRSPSEITMIFCVLTGQRYAVKLTPLLMRLLHRVTRLQLQPLVLTFQMEKVLRLTGKPAGTMTTDYDKLLHKWECGLFSREACNGDRKTRGVGGVYAASSLNASTHKLLYIGNSDGAPSVILSTPYTGSDRNPVFSLYPQCKFSS